MPGNWHVQVLRGARRRKTPGLPAASMCSRQALGVRRSSAESPRYWREPENLRTWEAGAVRLDGPAFRWGHARAGRRRVCRLERHGLDGQLGRAVLLALVMHLDRLAGDELNLSRWAARAGCALGPCSNGRRSPTERSPPAGSQRSWRSSVSRCWLPAPSVRTAPRSRSSRPRRPAPCIHWSRCNHSGWCLRAGPIDRQRRLAGRGGVGHADRLLSARDPLRDHAEAQRRRSRGPRRCRIDERHRRNRGRLPTRRGARGVEARAAAPRGLNASGASVRGTAQDGAWRLVRARRSRVSPPQGAE